MADQDIPIIDETVSQLPQDIKADLAYRGRHDLYFLAKAVLGYSDMTPSCHGPLSVFFSQNEKRFKLILMPRGHFKSSLITIAGGLQIVTGDPNKRLLICNETSTNAERFLAAIKQHIETNKVYRALYSEIIPKKPRRWSSTEIELTRDWRGPEPTIDTLGMTGAMTSRHYTDILVDDPISEEAVKSDNVMHDVITRVDKLFSLMVKPEKDRFTLVGTRWAYYDVYEFFIKALGDKMAKFIRGAIEDGQPIFPELITEQTLADARLIMGEYLFSCLYMNNPRNNEVQDFNLEDLRFWRWSTDEEHIVLYDKAGEASDEVEVRDLDITVSVDPSPAETTGSDPNAVVTCGVTPRGQVIVLDTWEKRCTPLDLIEYLFYLKQRYNPRVFGIEGVAYQKSLKYFIKADCERRGIYMNIEELKPSGGRRGKNRGATGEKLHIRGLQPIAATGRLFILPTQHTLRNQLADYPLGKHDDVIDALAMQMQMWRGIVSPERMARYKRSERDLIMRARRRGLGMNHLPVTRETLEVVPIRRGRVNPKDIPHPDDLGLYDAFTDVWDDVIIN